MLFEPPQTKVLNTTNENITEENNSPSIEEKNDSIKISRSKALNDVKRIKIENSNIKGSISTKGAIIDDIIFKNYKEEIDSEERVILLNPKNSSLGYFY